MTKRQERFVSGLPLRDDERPKDNRSIADIVNTAIEAKRRRKKLHQRYDSEQTPQTRKVGERMFPDK